MKFFKYSIVVLNLVACIEAIQHNCNSNDQCKASLKDDNACCLYFEGKGKDNGFNCATEKQINYYLKSRDYNSHFRMWPNPHDETEQYIVYCKSERMTYPYI